jgi:hypothetical protein
VQHRTPAACVLVQPADAARLFGRPATAVSVPNSSHAASVCGFNADTSSDKNAIDNITYSLLAYVYDGTTQYSPGEAKGAKTVEGVGERAFTVVHGDLLTLAFVKNGETVVIAYSITGLANHPKPAAATSDVIALAKTAASRV